jgi:hypothetical protein
MLRLHKRLLLTFARGLFWVDSMPCPDVLLDSTKSNTSFQDLRIDRKTIICISSGNLSTIFQNIFTNSFFKQKSCNFDNERIIILSLLSVRKQQYISYLVFRVSYERRRPIYHVVLLVNTI